ncbi:hypothetical protein C8R43DRAFT_945101 [Mycena crocata]|nr:hypothetical protein C8R43DRAFT_945101 [Mycena crocata]
MNPAPPRDSSGVSRPGDADNPWWESHCIPKPGRHMNPILVDENGQVVDSLRQYLLPAKISSSASMMSGRSRAPHLRDWPHPIGMTTRARFATTRANGEPMPGLAFNSDSAPAASASRGRRLAPAGSTRARVATMRANGEPMPTPPFNSDPALAASASRGRRSAPVASTSHRRQPLEQRRVHPYTGPLRIINAAARREHQLKGFRPDRVGPFPEEEFYIGDARPEPESNSSNHQCCMCFNIKSHPVNYGCGHTDCYICVRRLVETSWHCPQCRAKMHAPPTPCDKTKASIAAEHPEWNDPSSVTFSWKGIRFPQMPYEPDSD